MKPLKINNTIAFVIPNLVGIRGLMARNRRKIGANAWPEIGEKSGPMGAHFGHPWVPTGSGSQFSKPTLGRGLWEEGGDFEHSVTVHAPVRTSEEVRSHFVYTVD